MPEELDACTIPSTYRGRDANETAPLLLRIGPVVDDLCSIQVLVPIKDLLGLRVACTAGGKSST